MIRLRLIAPLIVVAVQLQAQEAVVQVTNRANGGPLPGALVSLRTEQNQVLVRALTNERGVALLRAGSPGSYRIRADAIGFAGETSSPQTLSGGGQISVRLSLTAAPFALDEVVVTGSRSVVCDLDHAEGGTVARIWDEAGKALTATTLTRSRGLEFEIRTITRQIRPGGTVASERFNTRRGPSQRPFQTADPEVLHKNGYVVSEYDGAATYFGPDADLLLSDRFLDDHCFGLADEAPAGHVGLTFTPVGGRRVPDIRGTLWLDGKTLELSHLEFGYTGVDFPAETQGVGGRVDFAKLPNGGWIVKKWHIRMPVIAQVKGSITNKTLLAGYQESGGEAALVGTGEFSIGMAIVGTVFDSLAGEPLGGATVSIQGGAFTASSRADGTFRLEPPAPGAYLVTLHHRRFRLLGVDSLTSSVTLRRGFPDTVAVALPGSEALARNLCGDTQGLVVTGQVRDAGTTLPLEATVTITLPDPAIRARPTARGGRPPRQQVREAGTSLSVDTDADGFFRLCGLPTSGAAVMISAAGRGPVSRSLDEGRRFLVLDIAVP